MESGAGKGLRRIEYQCQVTRERRPMALLSIQAAHPTESPQ
jgi:hypothetical protein